MIQRLHVQTSWAGRRSTTALSLERLKYRFFKFQTFWYKWVCFLFLLEVFSPFKPSLITYRVQTLAFSSINQKWTTENPNFWLNWTQQIQAQNNRPLSINGVDWLRIIEVNAHLLMFSFIFNISMPWGNVLLPWLGSNRGDTARTGEAACPTPGSAGSHASLSRKVALSTATVWRELRAESPLRISCAWKGLPPGPTSIRVRKGGKAAKTCHATCKH